MISTSFDCSGHCESNDISISVFSSPRCRDFGPEVCGRPPGGGRPAERRRREAADRRNRVNQHRRRRRTGAGTDRDRCQQWRHGSGPTSQPSLPGSGPATAAGRPCASPRRRRHRHRRQNGRFFGSAARRAGPGGRAAERTPGQVSAHRPSRRRRPCSWQVSPPPGTRPSLFRLGAAALGWAAVRAGQWRTAQQRS